MNQETVDDYLKAIYKIYCESGEINKIHLVDIAKALKIKKSSVSSVVKKLTSEKYLKSEPYKEISLTKKGFDEAKRITHNHRVIEYFLKETLKCDTKDIHEEAHALEHAFSDETIRKLDDFLGNPKISPHGKKIHDTLDNMKEGSSAEIDTLVCPLNTKFRLCSMGVSPGQKIEVIKNDMTGPLIVKVFDSKIVIGREEAKNVQVNV